MPAAAIKRYAELANKSTSEVEKVWDEAKKDADKKFGKDKDENYWRYVNFLTQARLGIKNKIKEEKSG